jgi:hypothetical protein
MGDTTFVNGGITTSDTELLAYLKDDTGINISNYGIGNSLIAILDNEPEEIVLNDYYLADVGNATSGWIKYPLKGLQPGRHVLRLRAWDVFNNSAERSIEFYVTDGNGIQIESFANYPNPFEENTTLFFTHNRSGDELQAQVFILKTTGELIQTVMVQIPESEYRVTLPDFRTMMNDKKLPAGLYLARLVVRSLSNGSKNEHVTKLIISN